jgi:hypothetical protein
VSEAPLGPRKLPLAGQTDEDFEELCHQLVLIEHEDAFATDSPDGGADSLLPDGSGGYERAWQAKRYEREIRWPKCEESLDRAVATYRVKHYTFCFPKNLTHGQLKKFKEKLASRHPGVTVDFWDKSKLLALLNGSDQGERIIKQFFGEGEQDLAPIYRSFRAGGKVESGADVFERGEAIGEFLAKHDPFFSYFTLTQESGAPSPPALTPGAMIRVSKGGDGATIHIDAVPRNPEVARKHAPQVRIGFTDDEAGRQAQERFREAVDAGNPVSLEEGIEVTPTVLPPLFSEDEGTAISAAISLEPLAQPPPVRLSVRTDLGQAQVEIPLRRMRPAPDGSDGGLQAERGGLTFTLLHRRHGESGEVTMNWNYHFGAHPVRDQLEALTLLKALHGRGEFHLQAVGQEGLDATKPLDGSEWDEEIESVLQILTNMRTIEEWSGVELEVPESISGEEATQIALAATHIRQKTLPIKWERIRIDGVTEEGWETVSEGGVIKLKYPLAWEILGRFVPFAEVTLVLPETRVRDLGPTEADPSLRAVEILSPEDGPIQAEATIEPPGEPARKLAREHG